MPYAVDAASKLHDRQIKAATKLQGLIVKGGDSLLALRAKSPQAPKRITEPLAKVVAPAARVVGTPSEVAESFATRTRDWVAVQRTLQDSLVDLLLATTTRSTATPTPEPKPRVTPTKVTRA
jgi:hypothetical protein